MKLHLPTKLRAAVIAAMAFFATAPAVGAMEIDTNTAVYDALLMGSADSIQIPLDTEPTTNYHNHTLTLPYGMEHEDSWSMVIQSTGWNTISDQLLFGWNDTSVMFGDGKHKWLTYSNLNSGFGLMISNGYLIMMTPDSYTTYNDSINKYKENGLLLSGLGRQNNVDVEITLSYDRATKVLTVQNGTLKDGKTEHEITKHTYENINLPATGIFLNNTDVGGSSLNPGAITTVTVILPGNDHAWNISGLTSLEGLKASQYMDVVSGDDPVERTLYSTDGIYFVGGEGVLFTESDQTIDNQLGTALIRETPTIPSSIGLGADTDKKLTVTQGATALGQGSGLRIVGGGTVELQAGAAETTNTKLSIADGSTLVITGDNNHNFEVTGSSITGESSLAVEGGTTLKITDGGSVHFKSVSTTSGNSYLSGQGAYNITNLSLGGNTSCIGFMPDTDSVVVTADSADISATYFNILAGNSLRVLGNATFTGDSVTVMDKMTAGTVSSEAVISSMNASNWANYVTLDKLTASPFSVGGLSMDSNTGKTSVTSLNNALATVARGGVLSAINATNTTFSNNTSSLAASSLTGGLNMSTDDTSVATITAATLDLNSSTLAGKDSAAVTALGINDGETLTVKDTASLSAGSITGAMGTVALSGAAQLGAGTMNFGSLTATDSAAALVEGSAVVTTLTAGGSSLVTANELTAETLDMSGDAVVSAATMHITDGSITVPSTATTGFVNVDITDGVLGTTTGVVGGISGDNTSEVTIGTGYTLIGGNTTPAEVAVNTLNLDDDATLSNIAIGETTKVLAAGTQNFDKVTLAGGYSDLSFNGATPYVIVSGVMSPDVSLTSVELSGTATSTDLNLTYVTVNGENLEFTTGSTWTNHYTLFTTDNGVSLNFDAANNDLIQFNITPYTYAKLQVEEAGDSDKLVIYGREAQDEIVAALRNTPNRAAAIDALAEAAAAGATGELMNVFNYAGDVYHPTEAQRQGALSAASGASFANLSDAQRRGIEDVQKNLRNRVVQMGGANEGLVRNWESADIQAWVQGDGAYHTLSQSSDKAGYNYDVWGGTVGANLDITSHFTAGLSLSAEYGSLSGKGADSMEADTEHVFLSAFGRYQKGHWTHLGIFTFGHDSMDTTRTVLGYKGEGSTSGTSLSGYYELGYLIPLGEENKHLLQPIVNISLSSAKMNGFSETGSIGTAGLKYDANSLFYGNVGVGARYQAVLAESVHERNTVLELRGQLNEHFGDTTDEADVSFIGGGHSFTTTGADGGNFGVQLGAGLSVPVGVQVTLFADADAEFRAKQTDVRANIGVRYDF